jgi:hypothetical protein
MKTGVHNIQKNKKLVSHENLNESRFSSDEKPNFLNSENFDMDSYLESFGPNSKESKNKTQRSPEFTIFNFKSHSENENIKKEISELTHQIRIELKEIQTANKGIASEIKDIEKASMEYQGEIQGIYHVRFLETLVSILHLMRQKVQEGQTWLRAINSRRKKRGFMALSKAKGTQYSLSTEHQVARSTQ